MYISYVPLGIYLFKNELNISDSDDMLDIILKLHQYIPSILSTEQAYSYVYLKH